MVQTILAVFDEGRLHSIDWLQIKPSKAFVCFWESQESDVKQFSLKAQR